MRASLQWMRDYVDYQGAPAELAERLTMAGVPVEEIEVMGENIQNVVTGKILSVEKHPDADKLVVCQVDVGDETLQICTGASNVKAGQVVPVAKPGAHLPGGIKIKKSKLRGVPSHGMLCSAQELELPEDYLRPEDKEGIYILPEDTPIGKDWHEFFGMNDTIFEFELTPNRADCFSMVGLAREFAALFSAWLHLPQVTVRESEKIASEMAAVEIAAPQHCERFTARVLHDVQVGESPQWLKERLHTAGIRSINNVVDVTNYVMHEYGLPLHAYDYETIAGHRLVARLAAEGEKVVTLDDQERILTAQDLVIADQQAAAGLAGIMGGARTEVTAGTKTVLLEAAVFNGATIRKTSRRVGLRSDASGRYERGADVTLTKTALDRAAQLLQEMGACQVAQGYLDVYPTPRQAAVIEITPAEIQQAIGVPVAEADMIRILQDLGCTVEVREGHWQVTAPEWRNDLHIKADLSEEVARVYGFERIPETLPLGRTKSGGRSALQTCAEYVKDFLVREGLAETISYSFMNGKDLDKLHFADDDVLRKAIPIINPITEELPEMRTSLLPGLLKVLQYNLARKNENVAIFEYGAVFLPQELPLQELPHEAAVLAGILYGQDGSPAWPNQVREYDFFDLKGLLELLLSQLGISNYEVAAGQHEVYHPGKSAEFRVDGKTLVRLGELHPFAQDAYRFKKSVWLFEVDMELLAELADFSYHYQAFGNFPAITRDLALLVPENVTHEVLVSTMQKAGGRLLKDIQLFDLYRGEPVPQGMTSMAFSLVFREDSRTLTDAEVEESIQKIMKALADIQCTLR